MCRETRAAYIVLLVALSLTALALFILITLPDMFEHKSPGQRLADEVYACERQLKFPEPDEVDYWKTRNDRGRELGVCLDNMRSSRWYQLFGHRPPWSSAPGALSRAGAHKPEHKPFSFS
jgi:hypothetical protein